MTRIDRLTPEQEARFDEFVEKWTAIGLSTAPADRPAAEAAIRTMYQLAGLDPPRRIVWCSSPLSQGLTRAIVMDPRFRDAVGERVKARVWDSVGESVWANVGNSVWPSAWEGVSRRVEDSVWQRAGEGVRRRVVQSVEQDVWQIVSESVGQSVGQSVWQRVWARIWPSVRQSVWQSVWQSVDQIVSESVGQSVDQSVGHSVRESVRESVRHSVWEGVYGQHEAGWLAFYDFFRSAVGLTSQTDRLAGMFGLARSAGWALPHEHICWVSERHHILERDEQGRLHCLTGPAVMYPDGWAIYAVHGVRVPREVVEAPESLTVQRIHDEPNVEVRHVMMERFGWQRYLHESGAHVLDEIRGDAVEIAEGLDGLPVPVGLRGARLYRVDVPGAEPLMMVALKNSTPEPDGSTTDYVLRVPPDVRTVREAVAWTFGVGPDEYAPLIET